MAAPMIAMATPMKNEFSRVLLGLSLIFTLGACANGPCRQVLDPQLANQPRTPAKTATTAPPTGGAVSDNANAASASAMTVLIFKPDGSLQCGMGKKLTPEEMEKQSLAGIKVYSRDNRNDGLMRIQVCGSPTGMINVFEISGSDLKEAEKRGFKKLESR